MRMTSNGKNENSYKLDKNATKMQQKQEADGAINGNVSHGDEKSKKTFAEKGFVV